MAPPRFGVEERLPTVNQVHPQRPVHDHPGGPVAVAEGRGRCSPLVAGVALGAELGDGHHGRGRGYHASFVVQAPDVPLPQTGSEVGVDLGLSSFAALSDGQKLDNPRFARKAQRKLTRAQRALCRKQKGSNNRAKARAKVARAHAKVGDARGDWLHQQSTRIIGDNQAVYAEDLAVAGLARRPMARSVHDAGWSTFVDMLEYEAARHGRTFARIDRWFPSTRTCSSCGRVGDKLPLSLRYWTCLCGAIHDRDINAAINILAAGRADRPTPVELVSDGISVPQSALKQEPAGSTA